jgi:SAM-dependent methyltransferase
MKYSANTYYKGESGEIYFLGRSKDSDSEIQKIKADKFKKFISSNESVLDLGCGNGEILKNIDCGARIGIEINEESKEVATNNKIEVFESTNEIKSESVDVVISHHALEHLDEPYMTLLEINRILLDEGKLILVVPAENPHRKGKKKYKRNDIAQHLYCWNAQTLGNLVIRAGFKIEVCKVSNAGESTYLKSCKRFPLLYNMSKIIVAYLKDRYEVFCLARKIKR